MPIFTIVRDRSYFMGQLRVVEKGSERRLHREGSPIKSEGEGIKGKDQAKKLGKKKSGRKVSKNTRLS